MLWILSFFSFVFEPGHYYVNSENWRMKALLQVAYKESSPVEGYE